MAGKIKIMSSPLVEYSNLMGRMSFKTNEDDKWPLTEQYRTLSDECDKRMTTLLKTEVAYFCKSLLIQQMINNYAILDGILEVEAFIDHFKRSSDAELLNDYVYALLELSMEDKLAFKAAIEEDEYLGNAKFDYDNLMEFIEGFSYMRDRLVRFFESFYEKVFRPLEANILKVAGHEVALLQNLYDTDAILFIKRYIKVNVDSFLKNDAYSAVFYVSVTQANTMWCTMVKNQPEKLYIGFGAMLIQIFKVSQTEELLKFLGENVKREIIKMLGERAMYSSELANELGLSRATMSHHIHQLVGIGVIEIAYSKGNKAYYKVNIDQIRESFNVFLEVLERK